MVWDNLITFNNQDVFIKNVFEYLALVGGRISKCI
jgi:hypothetical protein